VTRAGLVVLGLVAGADVTVGSVVPPRVVLPRVVSRGVVSRGVVSGPVVPGTPGGTVIAGGGPVVGGGGGVGGTGTVGAADVVGLVRGDVVVLVRRRSDRSDESLPQPATTSAVPSETITHTRSVTSEVCPTGSEERRQERLRANQARTRTDELGPTPTRRGVASPRRCRRRAPSRLRGSRLVVRLGARARAGRRHGSGPRGMRTARRA
jgi:hypothetical protein